MKIKTTDVRCAVIGDSHLKPHQSYRSDISINSLYALMGDSLIVRITTDAGISGYGQVETTKPYLKPFILFYKEYLVGEDPTNVERIMLKIRRMGGFKPWGSAVSAIETALWDIAGKAANIPVYKLLGGKIRNQVRSYSTGYNPNFTIIKRAIGFHGGNPGPKSYLGNLTPSASRKNAPHPYRGPLTELGLKSMIKSVEGMK